MAFIKNTNEITNNTVESIPWKQWLETLMILFNLHVTLWLFSHSSCFSITLKAFCFCYDKLNLLFNNTFYTFLLLNAIILSLYAFSNTATKNGDVSTVSNYSNDFYDEYLNHTEFPLKITENEKETATEDYKPVTCSAVMDHETVTTAVTEMTKTTTCRTTVSTKNRTSTTSGDEVTKKKKCYRRIQSESVERRRMVTEFKRYNTSFSMQQRQGRSCHVERLSKEEFNRAVEDFIAKQKSMLREEQRKTEETECLGLIR